MKKILLSEVASAEFEGVLIADSWVLDNSKNNLRTYKKEGIEILVSSHPLRRSSEVCEVFCMDEDVLLKLFEQYKEKRVG